MGITLSAIVTGCERSISIPSAIKAVNNSIFSATETINRATSPMIFLLQRTIPLPNTIVDATPTIIGGSQITAPEVQIIIYVTKTIMVRTRSSLDRIRSFPDRIRSFRYRKR